MHSPQFEIFSNDYSRCVPYCHIGQSLKTKQTENINNKKESFRAHTKMAAAFKSQWAFGSEDFIFHYCLDASQTKYRVAGIALFQERLFCYCFKTKTRHAIIELLLGGTTC